MISFSYIILYVNDVPKAMQFYQNAFKLKQKMLFPDQSYGELVTGDTILAFATKELAASNLKDGFIASEASQKPFGIELGFATKEVESALKAAQEAGATIVEPATLKEWGQTIAYIRDLDGFLIEICTPMN